MMDFDPAEIQDLTIDEIAGVITGKEKEYLYRVIAENQKAFELWQKLHQELGPQQVREAEESMRALGPQQIIDAHKKSQSRKRIIKSFSMAAFVMLLLIAGAWYFLYPPVHKQGWLDVITLSTVPDEQQHVLLYLQDGKTFDLSVDTQKIQVPGMTIINTNNTLRYTVHAPLTELITLTVPRGMDYNIVMPDGSSIQLNSSTTLIFPAQFTDSTREIAVRGEAYLKIAADTRRPFSVTLPDNSKVKVLGTEFNVNTYDSSTVKVALVNGSISMKKGESNTLLQPGQEIITTSDGTTKINQFNEVTVLGWRKGTYVFGDTTTLQEVCRVLSRWYGVNAVIDNPHIENKTFSGLMDRNKPLDVFLKNVTNMENSIRYNYDNKGTLHFK